MSERDELRARIEARRKALEADLARLKAEGIAATNDARRTVERKLDELSGYVSHGWDNLSDAVARKLNDWLD